MDRPLADQAGVDIGRSATQHSIDSLSNRRMVRVMQENESALCCHSFNRLQVVTHRGGAVIAVHQHKVERPLREGHRIL